jgi:hypothetical protein
MHLSHHSGLVMVLDVPSDWAPMVRIMSLHNHMHAQTASYNEPLFRVLNSGMVNLAFPFPTF